MPPPRARSSAALFTLSTARWMRRAATWLACVGLVAATAGATATAGRALAQLPVGDPVLGKLIYDRRCSSCHSADANGEGPAHRGVVGRLAGSLTGFNYSDAMRKSGLVWDQRSLDAWLTDPETLLPGQAMDAQVSDPMSRSHVIAYLSTLKR